MQLTKEKRGECSILMVHGRLDGTTSPKFETEVLAWLAAGGKSFVLDMAGISFMSSAALRVLLSMAKRVGRTGGKVVLSSPNAVVSEVFEISNFSAMFTICPTLDEGVSAATSGVAPSAPAAAAEPAAKAAPAPIPAPPVPAPKAAPAAPPPVAPPAPAVATPPPVAAVPTPPPVAAPPVPPAPPSPEPVAPPVAAAPTPVVVEPAPIVPAPHPVPPPPAPTVAETPVAPPTPPPVVTAPATPPPIQPTPTAVTPPAAPPIPAPAEPKTSPSPVAPPAPAAKKAGPLKLEVIVGSHIIECRDGDVIGLEGTVAPHLFKSASSMQPRHVLIGKGPDAWFLMVPRNVQAVTHLDNAVLTPGVRQDLSGEHHLKVGDFAVSLRLSEGQSASSINDSFFTRLMKILHLG